MIQNAADQDAVFLLRMFEERLHVDAQPASTDPARGHQLRSHALGQIAGNRASQTEADFVDADDFTP